MKEHILLVEDDTALARLVQKKLGKAGYAVDIARNGEDGLARYAAGSYGAVIVDYSLPGRDGLEVVGQLAAGGGLPPTIMVTASGSEKVAVAAMKLGVGDYIVKDIGGGYLDLLPVAIERVVEQHRLARDKRHAEEALQARTRELAEQVKKLNCLFGISRLLEGSDRPVHEVSRRALALVAAAWQYPEITCARIALDGEVFQTDGFRETPWRIGAAISVDGRPVGAVDVCYLEERPLRDEGPFLKEERGLIDDIAERLGRYLQWQTSCC